MPAVYTRTGDKGLTGLLGGTRLPKQSPAVEAYGTVDETNAAIGVAKTWLTDEYHDVLHTIQRRLFVVAAELASDDKGRGTLTDTVSSADVELLEHTIDECLAFAGKQRAFVIPGRDPASSYLHQARTITRRAERRILTLAETTPVREEVIRYMNRLSDTLYAIARVEETKHDLAVIESVVREAVGRVTGSSSTSSAQVRLDLATAKALAQAAEDKGHEMNIPIVFAAVDFGGNLILVHRQSDSLLASIDIAIGKAYTAAALKMSTADLGNAAGPTGPLYGIESSNQGKLILFGGGIPIFCEGVLLGGIGVSGGTVDEDVTIIEHAYHKVYRS